MLVETAVEAARRFGDRPAFVTDEGLSLGYAEFHRICDETAVGMAELGVAEGDVVALALPPTPEHFIAYLAAAKLGAVTAAVNPKLVASERDAVLRVARPKVIIAPTDFVVTDAAAASTVITVAPAVAEPAVFEDLRRSGQVPPPLATDPDRPVAIVFTSGTTGTPKGVVFTGTQIAFITQCDVGDAWGGGGH